MTVKDLIKSEIDWYKHYRDNVKMWSPTMATKLEVYEDVMLLLEHAESNGGKVTESFDSLRTHK